MKTLPQSKNVLFAIAVISMAFVGCRKMPPALDAAGPQSQHIADIWWLNFWITLPIYVIVVLLYLVAVRRRRRLRTNTDEEPPLLVPDASRERRMIVVVAAAIFLTTALLFVLLIGDFSAARAMTAVASEPNPVSIKITGHQWWWEIRYAAAVPSNILVTANEIHIPIGRPVQLQLESADVIHSFWIPNLHGKKDLIPGHPTSHWLRADRAGTYYGQCAEFCGYQHAHMRLVVVAEPEEKFESWRNAQLQPATTPTTDSAKLGYAVFMSKSCVMCHAISGTPANGMVGPDLTHIASRTKLGANSFPTTRGHLGGWVINPQSLKPGVHMPQNQFEPGELHALLDYLESLK